MKKYSPMQKNTQRERERKIKTEGELSKRTKRSKVRRRGTREHNGKEYKQKYHFFSPEELLEGGERKQHSTLYYETSDSK